MPSRDLYHHAVVHALVAEGWEITDDPLALSYGGRDLFVDLGATCVTIGAARSGQRIVVEIKSFLNPSPLVDLEQAVGRHEIYRTMLHEVDPERRLFLAVPQRVAAGILNEGLGQLIIRSQQIGLIVFDEKQERIVRWTP